MNIDYIKDINKEEALQLLFYLWGDYRAKNFISSLISKKEILGCFTEENTLVGIITFKKILAEIEIDEIITHPDFRNRGVGSALIDGLVALCRPHVMRLELRKSNKNALSFYQNRAFEVVGERIAYYQNPVEDALLLTRSLN